MWLYVLQKIFWEFLFDIIYFPLWWFTGGLVRAGRFCLRLWQGGNLRLAPGLWLKNLLVPMFGQTDWQGRLMSLLMRFANVLGRAAALLVWSGVVLGLFALWLILPVFVVYQFFHSF